MEKSIDPLEALKSGAPPQDLSFLIADSRLFWCHYPRSKNEPWSSVFGLIHGVYDLFPEKARELLRHRIFTTSEPTEFCRGAVKVSAKRLSLLGPDGQNEIDFSKLPANTQYIEIPAPAPPTIPEGLTRFESEINESRNSTLGFMELALNFAQAIPRSGPRYQQDRKIAAVLASREGQLLAWGVSTNSRNRTQHAEYNLLRNYYDRTGQPLPQGARIYTTLKPCKMCAGAIWTCAEDPLSLQVFYEEEDRGRNARSTILDSGSAERKRAAPEAIEAVILRSSTKNRS